MELLKNPRIENYIKFSYIKSFVDDLASVYDYEEPLIAYKHFMEEANILHDTEEFVNSFSNVFSGKHRAKYCDGVYVNIPKFLSLEDENKEIILESLSKLQKIFNDTQNECKELVFIRKHTEKIANNIPENTNNASDDAYMQQIVETLKPGVKETQDEFKSQKLNVDRFIKIIIVGIYDKVDTIETLEGDDSQHIKKIITIIANSSLRQLASKQGELIREFMSIKNLTNLPYKSILSGGLNSFQ